MEKQKNENIINEATKETEKVGEGFKISPEQAGSIAAELSKFHDAIIHDQPIKIEDIENLGQLAGNMKIDVGGEIMTVEEVEKIPDLMMNIKIWREMSRGILGNTNMLTRITPSVSKYLENEVNIVLSKLVSPEGLVLPRTVKGAIILDSLTSAKYLILPDSIGGALSLDRLTSAEGLILPSSIGRGLSLSSLTSAKGLAFPSTIAGNLYLTGLTSAEGLVLPTAIGGSLDLNSLTSTKGLVLPDSIGHKLSLKCITPADREKLLVKYPQYRDKII